MKNGFMETRRVRKKSKNLRRNQGASIDWRLEKWKFWSARSWNAVNRPWGKKLSRKVLIANYVFVGLYTVRCGRQVRYTSLLMWKAMGEFPYFVPQWRKYRGDRTDVGSGDAKTSQTRRNDVFVVLVVLHGVMTASSRFTTCKLAATSWDIRKKVRYCGAPPTVQRRAFATSNHAASFRQLKSSSWHAGRNVGLEKGNDLQWYMYIHYVFLRRYEKTYFTFVSFSI